MEDTSVQLWRACVVGSSVGGEKHMCHPSAVRPSLSVRPSDRPSAAAKSTYFVSSNAELLEGGIFSRDLPQWREGGQSENTSILEPLQ